MTVETVYVQDGKCIEIPNESVSIMSFPDQLQQNAAVQYIFTAIIEGEIAFNSDMQKILYSIISSINLANYIIPVFKDKNENARYLLTLELSNLCKINGIKLDQNYLYSRLFE